jgi:hypothetical protein
MAQVTLKNVYKKFGDVSVVKDVTLTVPDKSFFCRGRPVRLRQIDDAAHGRRT